MSRRIIQGFDVNHLIIVGFDPGTSAFFGQVWDKAAKQRRADDALIAWLPFAMLPTPETLAQAMIQYVQLDATTLALLHVDATNDSGGTLPRGQMSCNEKMCVAKADVICDSCGAMFCRTHSWHIHIRLSGNRCSQYICCHEHTQAYVGMIHKETGEDVFDPNEYLTVVHRGSERIEVEDERLFQGQVW